MRVRSIRDRARQEAEHADEASPGPNVNTPKSSLTETEAAQYIGMSAAWLKKSRTRRFRDVMDAPPFVRAGAKRVVYRREDLDAWLESHLERVGPERGLPTAAGDGRDSDAAI